MVLSINYTKKEIKLNFDASRAEEKELPNNWLDSDLIKTAGQDDYERLKNNYKIL